MLSIAGAGRGRGFGRVPGSLPGSVRSISSRARNLPTEIYRVFGSRDQRVVQEHADEADGLGRIRSRRLGLPRFAEQGEESPELTVVRPVRTENPFARKANLLHTAILRRPGPNTPAMRAAGQLAAIGPGSDLRRGCARWGSVRVDAAEADAAEADAAEAG